MLQNPEDISKKAKETELGLLSAKFRAKYYKEYDTFNRWKENNGVVLVNEDALLYYLHEKVSNF
jgi:predicted  nucleic acid-binding Zn-ribbon protein